MLALHHDENVVELRTNAFNVLLNAALGCVVYLTILLIVWNMGRQPVEHFIAIAPCAALFGGVSAAHFLRRRQQLTAANWSFVLGLLLAPTLNITLYGPTPGAYLFYILPIVIAGLLIEGAGFSVTALAAALLFGSTWAFVPRLGFFGFLDSLMATWFPMLIFAGVAVMTSLQANLLATTLFWVTDSRHKAQHRAEQLQHQQAELDQTIVGLTVAQGDLRSLNEQLGQAKRTAEEANHLKTQFLAGMSHELRTPLNAIINFTHFIGKERFGTLNDRQAELQQRVLVNAEHLLGLINDILDLSKIEAGRMELYREQADLLPLLKGVMGTAAGLTNTKGLALTLEVADDLPMLWIDKTRVRQVLLNLLSNAAKFTDQGGITVRAYASGVDGVTISVQDTGRGIAPTDHGLVFEEFQQVQGGRTDAEQGTGLGLPISKRFIELHGGQMWLESQLGVGSTFSFTLPVAAAVQSLPGELLELVRSNQDVVYAV